MADSTAVPAWKIEADQRTKELTEKLENGVKELFSSDKYKEYLKAMSHFHNYSSRNIMLIHQQMPGATKVASFKLWKEKFNRSPKKGETSLRIFAPIGSKQPETKLFEKIDPETKKPMIDKDGNTIMEELTSTASLNMRFKLVPVFDVSQTVGEPLPQLAEDLTGNVEHYEAFLDTLKTISPLPIEFEPLNPEQDGYCRFGEKIGIREGMSEIQTVSAIIHEITHARLHDRNKATENDTPKSKEVKEIEAESVSYVVCQKYGIETGDNSFGYLASWSNHDMADFKASLDTIRKEANNIINAIDDRFTAICKERGIDLTAQEQPTQAPTPQKQEEATFTTESTTQNIAGVDFSFEEVKPVVPEKEQTAAKAAPPTIEQKNFEKLSELFPQITDNEFLYQRMEAGAGFMPLSVEWIGDNQLSIMHTFVQNGDLMYDPMIVFEVDREAKTATAVEFQQSAPPIYQRIEDGIGHSIDGNGNERTINNLQSQINDFASQWFENIGNQGFVPVQAVLRDEEYSDPTVYFNTDKKPFSLAFIYDSDGTTVMNNLDKGSDGRLAKVAYVDSFRNVEFFEDNLPKEVVTIIENVKLTNERTAQEKQAAPEISTPPEAEQSTEPTPHEATEPMPDPTITVADRDAYGYTAEDMLPLQYDRAIDLFKQDHAVFLLFNDGTEAMAFDSSEIVDHTGIYGIVREDWQKSHEYRALDNSTNQQQEAAIESAFINAKEDSFAIYQIQDGVEHLRDYRFEGLDYLEQRGWEVNRNNYVLVHTEPLSQGETLEDIFTKFNDPPKDFSGRSLSVSDVVVLNKDGELTNHYVDKFGFSELLFFLNPEKQPEQAAPAVEQNGTEGKEPPPPTEPPTTDTPEIPKKEQPIYKQSADYALEHDELQAWRDSRDLNTECGKAIDNAIIASNYEQYRYDLKTAARDVIEEFGADRMAWVVASNVNHHDFDGRLSNANKAWAKAFDTHKPDFHLKTHLAVLDGFVGKFREVEKEKPSLMTAIKTAEQKSKAAFGNTPKTGMETPDKTKKNNDER